MLKGPRRQVISMPKGQDRQVRDLKLRTGATDIECLSFLREFDLFLHFLSSYFGVKQSLVAHKVFESVRRAERLEELDQLGLTEAEAEAIKAIPVERKGPLFETIGDISQEELAAIFASGAERN